MAAVAQGAGSTGRPRLAGRLALAAVAALAAAPLLDVRRDDSRCSAAGQEVFRASGGFVARDRLDSALERLRDTCHDSKAILAAADVLVRAGLPEPAASLATEITRSEPRNYIAFAELELALRRRDPAGARRAELRARSLNPRYRAPR